jgi:hypothetical protein
VTVFERMRTALQALQALQALVARFDDSQGAVSG